MSNFADFVYSHDINGTIKEHLPEIAKTYDRENARYNATEKARRLKEEREKAFSRNVKRYLSSLSDREPS